MSEKPNWKKGDVLAMPQELQPRDHSVWRGGAVFIAKHDPEMYLGLWCYGFRPADEVRLATIEDVERLESCVAHDIKP